jgi:hypothetical protein
MALIAVESRGRRPTMRGVAILAASLTKTGKAVMKPFLLLLALVAGNAFCIQAVAEDTSITLEVTPLPDNRVRLSGKANLPPGTELLFSVTEKGVKGSRGQAKGVVSEQGDFCIEALGPKSGLQEGRYVAAVLMPIPAAQSEEVKQVIGKEGENLEGPLVRKTTLGVTVSQTTEFSIGLTPDKVQADRSTQAADKTAELKEQLCVHLEQLLSFKDDPKFKEMGFAVAGPYHKWLKSVEALRNGLPKEDGRIPFKLRAAPGELMTLGMDYMRKGETPYTQTTLPDLKKTISYESYLRAKKKAAH